MNICIAELNRRAGYATEAFTLLKAAMSFCFSSLEFLSHHKRRKSHPVSRASPAHMNSPLPVNPIIMGLLLPIK